ncbi:MAG TPA: hypothetical protein VKT82_24685 [Ktedonobacterales bacterium]|nr:hypothetical protein [Ktedonobacterales bacterium]
MCLETQDSAELDAWLTRWYAEQEGTLADLLERLEQEGPSLDALLAESQASTDTLLAELDHQAEACPLCGQALPKADQKPTSAGQKRGKSRVKRRR